jgi:hypothetical protein
MFAFVAPAVWRTLIPISLNGLLTALPQSLILRTILSTAPLPRAPSNAFNQRTLVVVRDGTTPIVVVDLDILFVTSHAVELRWWVQIREELCGSRERCVRQVVF